MKEHQLINQDSGNVEWYRKITRNSLKNAKARCYNKNNPAYKNYGGRGIKVTEDWLGKEGLDKFIEDLGLRPSELHSLDRLDVNGDYCKENCRWSTRKEQSNNRRDTIYIGNETLSAVCERLGITHSRGFHLYEKGFDFSKELPNNLNPVMLEINGEVKSLMEWCILNDTEYRLAYGRIKRGWASDKVFNDKIQPKLYLHNSESRTLQEWCKLYQIPYKKVHYRLNVLNWDLDSALTK